MIHLRNWLIVTLLALCCDVAWKASITLDRASTAISELSSTTQAVHQVIAKVGPQVEGAAAEQRRYYKATGKALAITTIKLGRTAEEAQALLADARHAVQTLEREVAKNGEASEKAIAATEGAAREAQGRIRESEQVVRNLTVASGALPELAGQLVNASASISLASGNTARATKSLAEAAKSVDEALKPLRKAEGRLKTVLKIILGMVKFDPRR